MTDTSGRVQLRTGVATDIGRVRSVNEDSYVLLPDQGLWVVADGMGGAQAGDVASQMAIDILRSSYHEPTVDALADAMAEANARIHAAARDASHLKGMGTTAVAIALVPEEPDPDHPEISADQLAQHLLVINVGDSRAYLFRDGSLSQLTEDHSVVAELLREGRINEQEAEAHPQRNIITRVLGVYPEVAPDIWPIDPIRGDRYLLCSDGLFNEVGDDQIAAVLRRLEDPSEVADELVRLALEGGGRDNVTVIVLDVVDDGGQAHRASRALAGDLAGFSSAIDRRGRLSDDELDGTRTGRKRSRSERRAQRKSERAARTRVTWRVLLFAVLVLGVIGGAFATIQWYGTSTYYVGFEGDEVTIFQGRPGGILWIEPELEDGTGILRDEVPARYLADLEEGHEQPSLARAKQYVSNIERDIADLTTTTTTTVPTGTTTAASSSTAN